MDIFKKTAFFAFVSASLIACGGGGSDDSPSNNNNNGGATGTTYKIENGAFQKGPFIAGTTVTIQELDDNLKATGKTYTTQTDDTGRFDVTGIGSRFVEVFANGYYYDELSNAKSKGSVTLRAILDLSVSSSKPSINTLTTLQTERLRAIKKNGKNFAEAEADSKNAVLGVFGLPENTVTRLDSINLTGTSAGDESLLRATVAMLQVASNQSSSVEAELTSLLANIGSDLKDDGVANGVAQGLSSALQVAQRQVDIGFVRSLLQEYLANKGMSGIQPIEGTISPKLSHWITIRPELGNNGVSMPPVIWLLNDDGSVWRWNLSQSKIEKHTDLNNILALHLIWQTNNALALDKSGNLYKINTQTNQVSLLDSSVKQITGTLYLKQNGEVHNWDGQLAANIPLMNRLVSSSNDMFNVSGGVSKLDGQLYYFQYDRTDNNNGIPQSIKKISGGKYSQAQLLLTESVSYAISSNPSVRYPAAILDGNTWSFFNEQGDKVGQSQKLPLGSIYAHVGGFGLKQWSPILSGDGKLWYYSENIKNFVESDCKNVKKMHRAEVVLLDNNTLSPIISKEGTGIGNLSCPLSTNFDYLLGKNVIDMFTLAGKWVVAITSDNSLIARRHDASTWQPNSDVYTISVPLNN